MLDDVVIVVMDSGQHSAATEPIRLEILGLGYRRKDHQVLSAKGHVAKVCTNAIERESAFVRTSNYHSSANQEKARPTNFRLIV